MEHHEEVVLVTGASSGIGNACAMYLAKRGFRTYGSCRDPAHYEKKADEFFELVQMDVTDGNSVDSMAKTIVSKEGHIDHVVCCAGLGSIGSVERSSVEDARLQMETDYFGTLRTIKAFLPAMREAGRGRVIVLASLIGLLGLPFLGHYSAAKRALEGLTESLNHEVRPFGIEACLLELGTFRSSLDGCAAKMQALEAEGPYGKAVKNFLERPRNGLATKNDPLAVAKIVHALLTRRSMPAKKSVGSLSLRFAVLGKRLLPTRAFNAFIRARYEA